MLSVPLTRTHDFLLKTRSNFNKKEAATGLIGRRNDQIFGFYDPKLTVSPLRFW